MWIVCQIGAREHYAIPRALHQAGELAGLVTDLWVPPASLLGQVPAARRLRDRWHEDLGDVEVIAPNASMLAFECRSKLQGKVGWEVIIERNRRFQQLACAALRKQESRSDLKGVPTLFSYSYAALDLFRWAKQRGWKTVLGQIDPGPGEDALVQRLREQHPEWSGPTAKSPPPGYWSDWREECGLADRIVVNSAWSKRLLVEGGVNSRKIEVIPLALDSQTPSGEVPGKVPERGRQRPLRLLFLGQALVRKGIQDLVAAARLLRGGDWIIDVVGPHGPLPGDLPECIRFHGGVARSETAAWYAEADVFILPTHSDGFALTQLEAMACGLPVIATACCGDVVEDGVNGWLVPAGDPLAMACLLQRIVLDSGCLGAMSAAAKETAARFNLAAVARRLTAGDCG